MQAYNLDDNYNKKVRGYKFIVNKIKFILSYFFWYL